MYVIWQQRRNRATLYTSHPKRSVAVMRIWISIYVYPLYRAYILSYIYHTLVNSYYTINYLPKVNRTPNAI